MENQVIPPETGPWAGRYRHWTMAGFLAAAACRTGPSRPLSVNSNDPALSAPPYDTPGKTGDRPEAAAHHRANLVFRPVYPRHPQGEPSVPADLPFLNLQRGACPSWIASELSLPLDRHFALYGTRLVWTSVSLPLSPFLPAQEGAMDHGHPLPHENPGAENPAANP